VLLLVDCFLLVVDCALMLLSVASSAIQIVELSFFGKLEGVENVGEEDSITIKTEQHYIQLVRTMKVEQEVCVFW
jgi:hypothetical protein